MKTSGKYTLENLLFHQNQDPGRNAIECPGLRPLTYRDLRKQVLSVVTTLNSAGYHRNDRIAVVSPAGPETAVIMVSIMAGFTCIALNPEDRQQLFETVFSRLDIRAVIVLKGSETAARAAAVSQHIPLIDLVPKNGVAGMFSLEPAVDPVAKEPEFAAEEDISHILFTAGTTASSKIVPVTQRQSFFSRLSQIKPFNLTPSDRCLHIVPYYHGLGIGLPLLGILFVGGTIICTRDFIPRDFFHLMKEYRPTYYIAVPALHQAILHELKKQKPGELQNHSLRMVLTSSAPMSEKVSQDLTNHFGVPVVEILASSEAGTISINFPPKQGSVGIPVVDKIDILDENNDPLGPGISGEIVVRGETVFRGYECAPEENEAAFIDGWYRTGDIGYLDNEGYLFLTGRKKELINKGGRKIAPDEIDTVLRSHPGVRDAMVFPVPDAVLGEDIAAMVVLSEEKVTETELRLYLLDRLVQFKIPKRIYLVDAIPKNPAGKPLRHAGSERYGQL